MRRTGGRARGGSAWAAACVVALMLALAGCGSSGSDGTVSTTGGDPTDRTGSPSTGGTTATGTKQTAPIEQQITLARTIAPADQAITFVATFRPTLAGTYEFRADADDPVEVVVTSPPELALDRTSAAKGTVRTHGVGTGSARLTATVTASGAGGSTEATTITVFVASSDGWMAVGTSSTSATQTALLDELRTRHIINDDEYRRRLEALTGGT